MKKCWGDGAVCGDVLRPQITLLQSHERIHFELDRFARNRYDSAHYKDALKKNGVQVISTKENIANGPEGIILESMLEGCRRLIDSFVNSVEVYDDYFL